jgi:hypothetical protein
MTTGCNVALLAEIEAVHCFTFLPDIGRSVQSTRCQFTREVRDCEDALGPSRTGISTRDACASLAGCVVDLYLLDGAA